MQGFSKALLASGLVILTGPLSLMAQDYVDVEAERAAASSAQGSDSGDPYDPYRVKPAQAYPTTSFGTETGTPGTTTMAPPVGGAGQNVGDLVFQLQQLQQEVMMLNGKLEEQAFELRRLREQHQERYVDLDRRIVALGGGEASVEAGSAIAAGESAATSATSGQTQVAVATPPPRSKRPPASEQPGEGEAYRAAYALVRGQQWDTAISSFNQFLRNFPDGRYAPNAHYWLGELYLVTAPPQLESARQSFMMLLTEYPDNNKVPDAMYKLGKVYFQKGNRDRGREYLDRVINEYGSSNSSAVQLAREFIKDNY